MPDSYQIAFTANVGPGIDVAIDHNPDGSLKVSVRAYSAVSIADAENIMQTAFVAAMGTAWTKAKS
jgi:hypothetical protein